VHFSLSKQLCNMLLISDHSICSDMPYLFKDWVPKRLMKLYIDFCKKLSEAPNKKLLTKLYNLEVILFDIYDTYSLLKYVWFIYEL
jgi:hypothetical protein